MPEIFLEEIRLKQQYLRVSYRSTGSTLDSHTPPYSSSRLFLFWFYRVLVVFFKWSEGTGGACDQHQRWIVRSANTLQKNPTICSELSYFNLGSFSSKTCFCCSSLCWWYHYATSRYSSFSKSLKRLGRSPNRHKLMLRGNWLHWSISLHTREFNPFKFTINVYFTLY